MPRASVGRRQPPKTSAFKNKGGRPAGARDKFTLGSVELARKHGDGYLPHEWLFLVVAKEGMVEIDPAKAEYFEGLGGKIVRMKPKEMKTNTKGKKPGEKVFLVMSVDKRVAAAKAAQPYFAPKRFHVTGMEQNVTYATLDPEKLASMAKEGKVDLEKALMGELSNEPTVDPKEYEAMMLEGERVRR